MADSECLPGEPGHEAPFEAEFDRMQEPSYRARVRETFARGLAGRDPEAGGRLERLEAWRQMGADAVRALEVRGAAKKSVDAGRL